MPPFEIIQRILPGILRFITMYRGCLNTGFYQLLRYLVCAMLAVMYVHPSFVQVIFTKLFPGTGVWDRLGQGLVLPFIIWTILGAMACITIVARRDTAAQKVVPAV